MARIEFRHVEMHAEFKALLHRVHSSIANRAEFEQLINEFIAESSDVAVRDLRTALMVYADLTIRGGIETDVNIEGKLN